MIPGSGRSTGEGIGVPLQYSWASLLAQLVKNPFSLLAQPVKNSIMWETWVQSLGWEDLLEKGRLPTPVFWPGEFHGLYSIWGHKESDMTEQLSLHFTSMGVRPRVLLDDGTWNIHMTGLTLMAFKARSELNYLMR